MKSATVAKVKRAIRTAFPEYVKELGEPEGVLLRSDGKLIIHNEGGGVCAALFDTYGDGDENLFKVDRCLNDAGCEGYFEWENGAAAVWRAS